MADSVNTNVQFNGSRRYIVRLTNKSDGTGESAVKKVDISLLRNGKGIAPTAVNVRSIQWSMQGFSSVQLFWDHTTDDLIDNLATGNGYRDYGEDSVLADPRSSGGDGSILLTTNGAVSGATYDLLLELILSD